MPNRQDFFLEEDYFVALNEYFEAQHFITDTIGDELVRHGRALIHAG